MGALPQTNSLGSQRQRNICIAVLHWFRIKCLAVSLKLTIKFLNPQLRLIFAFARWQQWLLNLIIVSQTQAGNAAFLLQVFWYAGTFTINVYLNAWMVTFFTIWTVFLFFLIWHATPSLRLQWNYKKENLYKFSYYVLRGQGKSFWSQELDYSCDW